MRGSFGCLGEFFREVLMGIGQIMLQPSAWVGAAFVVGMMLNSPVLTIFGVVGCVSGTLMARARRYPPDERNAGLYGFNGGLVGLGLGYNYAVAPVILIPVVFGGALSALITHRMLRLGLRPLTFPFVIVTWVIMITLFASDWMALTAWPAPDPSTTSILHGVSRGIGQVLFQEEFVTGLVFAAAIASRSWIQGVFAVLAAVFGVLCGHILSFPTDAINLGLLGYNAVLCGILFAEQTRRGVLSALAAGLLSILLVSLFLALGLPALTFPFVIASWIVLWGRARIAG